VGKTQDGKHDVDKNSRERVNSLSRELNTAPTEVWKNDSLVEGDWGGLIVGYPST
jgi:hypothetical protein